MSKEVVVCPECFGRGEMLYKEGRESYMNTCKTCLGFRVVYKIIKIEPINEKVSPIQR